MDTRNWTIGDSNNNTVVVLEEINLPPALAYDASGPNLTRFVSMWEREKRRAKLAGGGTRPSLHRAIVRDFLTTLWFIQPLMLATSVAKLAQAVALGYLLETFDTTKTKTTTEEDDEHGSNSSNNNKYDGYLWASILVISGVIILLEHHHVFFWTWRKGMQYRTSCVAAIFDKSLRLKSTSVTEQLPILQQHDVVEDDDVSTKSSISEKNKVIAAAAASASSSSSSSSAGKIVNIATNDVERLLMATLFGPYLFWSPVQGIGILCVGWWIIGWSFAAGFGILMCFFVPLQMYLSRQFAIMRSKIACITDERVTMVSQAISGVRVMKMSGWEENFGERIAEIRKRECDQIERVNSYRVLNEAIFFVVNVTTSFCIFVIHVMAGGVLTPKNVFTTMVLINVAQMEITKHFSLAIMGVSEAFVSLSRIQRFLETPELENYYSNDEKEMPPLLSTSTNNDDDDCDATFLVASDITCHWNGNGKIPTSNSSADDIIDEAKSSNLIVALEDINVKFDMGELTCVIGAVGSGKSALIQMLAGELPPSMGTLIRHRQNISVAYAPQDPWIMDGTVRENILLGGNYDVTAYSTVIRSCGLDVDFTQLRDGDLTIVGDRGVQLSGGQKARIALARCFYRDADIILLDDPLSAVDSRVGRVLFYSAILDLGVKRGKCVILVTHQHQFIGDSRCIMMSGGRITCVGSYQACVDASDGTMTFAVQNQSSNDLVKLELETKICDEKKEDDVEEEMKMQSDAVAPDIKGEPKVSEITNDHKEVRVVGEVKRSTFLDYARAMPGGIISGVFMMLLFTVTQGISMWCVAALGRWSEMPAESQSSASMIGIIGGLVGGTIILAVLRASVSFHLSVQASKKLHDDMTLSVLRSKIEFFDTNPIGRILNRFSSDVGSNDDQLTVVIFDFFVISFLVIGALLSTVVVLPITLVVFPPLIWYFIRVRRTFTTTSRELKRLEGLARGPIAAMLNESLSGISTIRANSALTYFQEKFRSAHDAHGRAFFAFIGCSRWLGFRMDALMFVFLTVATFTAVVAHQQRWIDVEPGILGLAISMLIQLAGLFQWCIRQSAEVVNLMVAVERVLAFRDLPSEAALENAFDNDVKGWPEKGEIDVNDLCVRYRKGLPLSLCGISFKIEGGTRVGVVGRTGGGKSTLVQALLRLLESESGQITIDGVDISKLGLHKLRTSVSVIPQSPVLYGGCSLRENLDPFHHHDDNQISEALSDVHMLDAVESLSHGLDTTVAENGLNFSVGQRQLFCLARAILRRNKILILDEPTANVDSRTDKLLQEAVAKSFEGATILAVAHRLDTVINYDKILVLGSGGVLEFGSPHELISNGGAFCSMIDDTGDEMAVTLKERARIGS